MIKFKRTTKDLIGARIGNQRWTYNYESNDGRFLIYQTYTKGEGVYFARAGYHWVLVDRLTKNKIEGLGSLKQAKRAATEIGMRK
jgi:hypothetical protein